MTHPLGSERAAALARAASAAVEEITGSEWPMLLAESLRDVEATWQESAEVCAHVAWRARAAGNSALVLLTPERVTDSSPGPVIWRTYRHLYLSTLRYDFRCRVIESLPDHPRRRACPAEAGPDEREASAVCTCPPPPPCLATSPVAVPAAPAPAHPRR